MIHLVASVDTIRRVQADVIAILLFEDRGILRRQVREIRDLLGPAATAGLDGKRFAGKFQQTLHLYPTGFSTDSILLLGAGDAAKLTLERLRRLTAAAVRATRNGGVKSLALVEPDPDALSGADLLPADAMWDSVATAMTEGVLLANYRYDKYLTVQERRTPGLQRCVIVTRSRRRLGALRAGMRHAAIVCEGTNLARDLENAPGNELYPESLAARARDAGRRSGFRVTVFDQRKIRSLRMGGLLGVAQGSERPPRFIVMELNRRSRKGTVVLVGKGVTFDSGGISIKPSANMAEMKMDMSGAAAVIGTMQAAARLRIPLHIVGIIPATENLPSGKALKPGDILTHANGMTSEVDNTDAEGRLILADALVYAQRYTPDAIIDLATLTGAVVVALGHVVTGMMGTDDRLMKRLSESGERTYERVWQLPLFEEYERLVKSDVADVKNVGGRWAGAITGAMFLKKFAGTARWVHLDIAGTAIMEESFEYIPKGGSGVGVRLLVDFLRNWTKA